MALKANFMNEIFELRSEITGVKNQICDRASNKNNVYDDDNLENPKSRKFTLPRRKSIC